MANRIAELRKAKSETLKQVGDAVDLKNNTISQYERGLREPRLETWQKLADHFGVSVPYLQGLTDEKRTPEQLEHYYSGVGGLVHELAEMSAPKSEVSKGALDEISMFLFAREMQGDSKVLSAAVDFLDNDFMDIGFLLDSQADKEKQDKTFREARKHFDQFLSIVAASINDK